MPSVFVGRPCGQNPQLLTAEGIGASPYGPGTITGPDGSRQPTDVELGIARNLGSRLIDAAGREELRGSAARGSQSETDTCKVG